MGALVAPGTARNPVGAPRGPGGQRPPELTCVAVVSDSQGKKPDSTTCWLGDLGPIPEPLGAYLAGVLGSTHKQQNAELTCSGLNSYLPQNSCPFRTSECDHIWNKDLCRCSSGKDGDEIFLAEEGDG